MTLKISRLGFGHFTKTRSCVILALALSLIFSPLKLVCLEANAAPAVAAVAGHVESNLNPAQTLPTYFNPTDTSFVHKYLKPGQYMPLRDVKAGMVGYGLTVFHGTRVERFKVEII